MSMLHTSKWTIPERMDKMGKVETDIVILGNLAAGPAHGYELKRRIDTNFGNFYINIINSLLYPRLTQYESEGLIEGKRESQDKVPDKKVYHITEAGRKKLKELVATPVKFNKVMPDPMDFTIHAVFFNLLTKEERRNVTMPFYEAYKAQYEKGMFAMKQYYPSMNPYMKLMMDYGMRNMKDNIELCERLLELD